MSSNRRPILEHRVPWASALAVLLFLAAFSTAAVRALGLHPVLVRSTLELPRIGWDAAVERSLAGEAVIVDFRSAARRRHRPVPGGAVVLPLDPQAPAWREKSALLESLARTDLLLVAGRAAWQERADAAVRQLRRLGEERTVYRVALDGAVAEAGDARGPTNAEGKR